MALRPVPSLRRELLQLELHAPLLVALLGLGGIGMLCAWLLRAPIVAGFVLLGIAAPIVLALRSAASLKRFLRETDAAQSELLQSLATLRSDVAQRSEEMAVAAQRLIEGVERITQLAQQPVEDAALSVETSSAQSVLLAERATEAQAFTDSARLHAEAGVRVVDDAGREIEHVSEIVDQSAQTLKTLSEKIASIGSIVDVIKEVADQTRLLSLNAAIEATRAGKYGGGFTAVANAVRQLADRTAQSTRQVGALILGIDRETQRAVSTMEQALSGVAAGLSLSRQAGQVLEQIYAGATRSATTVSSIAEATNELKAASLSLAQQIGAVALSIRDGNRLALCASLEGKALQGGLDALRERLR
jgi:methyl-accepting chemotaxis protein